jgi:hypothetical protein
MALPDPVRVKLSSEAAEYVSLTPVVLQEMALLELLERIVTTTGKDLERVRDILRRGSIVSGATRLRWQSVESETAELDARLRELPDDDPSRPFDAAACVTAVLTGASHPIEVQRVAAVHRRLLRRRSFWDEVLRIAGGSSLNYTGYQYRERSDRYRAPLDLTQRQALREAASLLRYSNLARQIRTSPFDAIELLVVRRPGS